MNGWIKGRHIAMFMVFLVGGCSEIAVPTDIGEPQFAKGGGKGKPGGGGDPVLQEFWVTPGSFALDPDVIHVVWSGAGTSVNPFVVWDYFFNGIRDDNSPVDEHYEYFFVGPSDTPGEQLDNGMMHVDIPWNGGRLADGEAPYPDYIATEVPGEGDPFAFRFSVAQGGSTIGGFTPFGVVVGGVNTFDVVTPEAEVFGLVHPIGTQRSYATFKGATPGEVISIEALEAKSLTCTVNTVTSGRGKNRTKTQQAVVSADIVVAFKSDPDIEFEFGVPIWWEGHFRDTSSGDLSHRNTRFGSGTFSFSEAMPDGWTGGEVEFIIDYVISGASVGSSSEAHEAFSNHVYDPGQNVVRTTAGLSDEPWSNGMPSASVGDGRFPVAHSAAVAISCGGE